MKKHLLYTFLLIIFSATTSFADGIVFATDDDLASFDNLVKKSRKSTASKKSITYKSDSILKKMIGQEKSSISKQKNVSSTSLSNVKDDKNGIGLNIDGSRGAKSFKSKNEKANKGKSKKK